MSQTRDRTILNFNDDDFGDQYSAQNSKVTDALLKESQHITNSEILLDEQLDLAYNTREKLRNQRTIIKSMQTQYNDIANRFPIISNILSKIQMRKRRDTIILGIVFAVCLCLFIYMLLG